MALCYAGEAVLLAGGPPALPNYMSFMHWTMGVTLEVAHELDRRNSFGVSASNANTQRRLAGSSPTLGLWPHPLRGRASIEVGNWVPAKEPALAGQPQSEVNP